MTRCRDELEELEVEQEGEVPEKMTEGLVKVLMRAWGRPSRLQCSGPAAAIPVERPIGILCILKVALFAF